VEVQQMKDEAETKKQLMEELTDPRQQVAELEASETYSRQA